MSEGSDHFVDFIGVAAPCDRETDRSARDKRDLFTRAERFAPGAFSPFHVTTDEARSKARRCDTTDVRVDHDRARVIARASRGHAVINSNHYLGLIVAFRCDDRSHVSQIQEWIASGELKGLSIKFGAGARSRLTASGAREYTLVPEVVEVSLCVLRPPAYPDTWLMPIGEAARARIRQERIEAEERFFGNAFIPGKSNTINSRTAYRRTLKPWNRRSA